MLSTPTNSDFKIAEPWKRILAFLVDIFFFLCLFRFALYPLFIVKNWDIEFSLPHNIIFPIFFLVLSFLFKDSLQGLSIGKFFFSLSIRKVQKKIPKTSFFILFIRNLFLFLLPLELFSLLFNTYARRWGDKWAGVFVLYFPQEIKNYPIRWLSKRVVFFILLVCFIVSGHFLTAPLQVKKSYAYQITTQNLENSQEIIKDFGKIIGYSYWVNFYYDKEKNLNLEYQFLGQYFKGKVIFQLKFDKVKHYIIKNKIILKN